MKSILEAGDLKNKRVLVRVDWSDHDAFRIETTKPTIQYLLDAGAKVVLATHNDIGSVEDLRQFVPPDVEFLPNLRDNPGEESNSEKFAKELASRADVFVNEAFSVSHRKHASIVGVPKILPSFAGLRFIKEVEELSKAFNPPHPFLLILGGAKFETKLPLVEKFLGIADSIFIAGANAKPASQTALRDNPKVIFPHGDLAAPDADSETIENCKLKIENSSFVLWNGPLGNYEKGFKEGTLALAKILANCGKSVMVGGGDTLAVIEELDVFDKFSFVSTGGGAMLDFLATGILPGIEALNLPHSTLS